MMRISYYQYLLTQVTIEDQVVYVFVLKRPGLECFLRKVSKLYEVVIFTASLSNYADPLMDILDGDNDIPFRLFREHCQQTSSGYIKNLSRLGRNLKDVLIIDNSPVSYSKHVANSLPILSWYDDVNDVELLNYLPVLDMIYKYSDVRILLRQIVVNDQISYTRFNKIVNEEKKTSQINKIIRNISPKSAQNKKIDYTEKHIFNNPNEAMQDDSSKAQAKNITIQANTQYKEIAKILNRMSTTTKNAQQYTERKKEPKITTEYLYNFTKHRSSSKPMQAPQAQMHKAKENNDGTPKENSKPIFKFTGIKINKDSAKGKYTNLIKVGISPNKEIKAEDKQIIAVTPKKPILFNNLIKEGSASHYVGGKDMYEKMREEINLNSPKHPKIVKNENNAEIKIKYERPITTSIREDVPIYKISHEKHSSLSIALDGNKKQYIIKAKKI